MHFLRLNIRGFGCLSTEVEFAPDRVNLIIADNETGKSTLIAALLAAFYGVVEDERVTRDKRPRRKSVLPWVNPEVFGLTLDFVLAGVNWRIDRDFNDGIVKLTDSDTGREHTAEYHSGKGVYSFGEELIGLSCSDFLKSFYLRQEEFLEIRDAGGLTPHVQRVATAREGGATSENAIERLNQALNHYPFPSSRDGLKIENALKRFKDQRNGLEGELDALERSRAEIAPECEKLTALEADLEKLRADRDHADILGDDAEIQELNRLVDAQTQLGEELDRLEEELKSLGDFEQFPAGKGDQLKHLAGKVEELTTAVANQKEKLQRDGDQQLARLEKDLQQKRELAGVTETELREFESAHSRLVDRDERLKNATLERDRRDAELREEGVERERFDKLKDTLRGLTPEHKRFIENFRTTYAEEDLRYRDAKSQREWYEREKNIILERRQRVVSTSRLFFIIFAMMAIAGGLLIMMIEGGWGMVLLGLGLLFAAVGAIIRGTAAGGGDVAALRKLELELQDALKNETEAKRQLDGVGRELNVIAAGIGVDDGNELLSQYFELERLSEVVEPLIEAEKDCEKASLYFDNVLLLLQPYFQRAGASLPSPSEVLEKSAALLKQFREAVKLGDEYRATKDRRDDYAAELSRLERDLKSNRELAGKILELGGIEVTSDLSAAVEKFNQSLEKHRRYLAIAEELLPRLKREILPEVDLKAKHERLEQLKSKTSSRNSAELKAEHSKEFYRDQAERAARKIESRTEQRIAINRKIGMVFQNYQNHRPKLIHNLDELDDAIDRAEAFQAEVMTAIKIMTEISREVYRSWAAALSEETTPFISALNPRYSKLQFSEDLSFTIVDKLHGRSLTSHELDSVLSAGARDEVFLAARLGIASYLSRGAKGAVPIVLDEPLASVDDDKFLSGMKFFLGELSNRHQVIILSCHAERHRWLADQDRHHFNRRVHAIELGEGNGETA